MAVFAGVYGPQAVIDEEGNAYMGVAIPVYLSGTLTPATIYSNFERDAIVANPVVVADGNLVFYADPGRYDYVLPDNTVCTVVLYADPNEPGGISGAFSQFSLDPPATSHTIHHNLGHRPAVVQAQDLTGRPVGVGVSHPDLNTTVIATNAPFAGSAWVG